MVEDRQCISWNFGRRIGMLRDSAKKPIFQTKTYIKYGFVIMEHEYPYCPNCKNILNAGPDYQPNYSC